jgi:hypothetical protein
MISSKKHVMGKSKLQGPEETREQSQTTQKSMENHSPNSSSISQKLITSVMLQEKHAGALDAANKCI